MSQRDLFLERVKGWLGWPYIWGAQNPLIGFDCSGLVMASFWSIGYFKTRADKSASMLWKFFAPRRVPSPYAGTLVFWADAKDEIKHIEVCIGEDDEVGPVCVGARMSKKMVVVSPLRENRSALTICGYADPFLEPEFNRDGGISE